MKKLIVVLLLGVIAVSHRSYRTLSEINDDLFDVVDKYKENNEELSDMWEEAYDELLKKYGTSLVEIDKLDRKLDDFVLPTYEFTESEIYLLAQCVEAEAGVKNYKSQKYVTQVVLNRLHSNEFPNTIEEVIYQKVNGVPQFSVAHNGMIDREVKAETLVNVYEVIVHGTDLPEYVRYFYADYVTDNWVNTLTTYDLVEGTVFAYDNKEAN